jgi:ADP-heptose:LPS heptosyltransferase
MQLEQNAKISLLSVRMTDRIRNLNLSRRPIPGLLAKLVTPLLKPVLRGLRRHSDEFASVYQSYMVGDFFMALPALLMLKKSAEPERLRVICRPDCVELLAFEGIEGIPFLDTFRTHPGIASFLRTFRAAWGLRGRLGNRVLDFDADPRTAFWLKIAGVTHTVSYRRDSGGLFDEVFPLPEPSLHQADRDRRVAEAWNGQAGRSRDQDKLAKENPAPASPGVDEKALRWVLSVWTRKPSKNWPLEKWEALIGKLLAQEVPFAILDAPDGDAEFCKFRKRWSGRVVFLSGSLMDIADAVRGGAGVVATDNFLGHMAGFYGKPVLWINRCSPAEQVTPRGPRTIAVTDPSTDEAWAAFNHLSGPL